jgi:hypothetical protein
VEEDAGRELLAASLRDQAEQVAVEQVEMAMHQLTWLAVLVGQTSVEVAAVAQEPPMVDKVALESSFFVMQTLLQI